MVGGGNYIEYQNLMDFASGGGGSSSAAGGGLSAAGASVGANLAAKAGALSPGGVGGGVGGAGGQGSKRIVYGCTALVNSNQVRNSQILICSQMVFEKMFLVLLFSIFTHDCFTLYVEQFI